MRFIKGVVLSIIGALTTASAAVVGGDLTVNSFAAYAGQTNIVLQATGNIGLTGGTLVLPPLPPGTTGVLTIQAGTNVVVNDGVTLLAGTGWSVNLAAGVTSFGPTPTVAGGDILFLGNSALVVADGSINLLAGGNITVGTGSIAVLGIGNIFITAGGNVSGGFGTLSHQVGSTGGGTVTITPLSGGTATLTPIATIPISHVSGGTGAAYKRLRNELRANARLGH